jgi:hypothetical protein
LRGAHAAWHTPQHWLYGWVEGVAEDRLPSDAPTVVSAARQWLPHVRQQASLVLKSSRPATWTVEWLRLELRAPRASASAAKVVGTRPGMRALPVHVLASACAGVCWPMGQHCWGWPAVCFMMVHARHAWHRTHSTQSMHPCSCLPAPPAMLHMHPVGAH